MSHLQTHETVMARFEPVTESGCWIWTGCEADGYGVFAFHGKRWSSHRYMYEYFIGPVPQGLVLDHLCRVRCCGNPWHLELVTNRVNILRGIGIAAQCAIKTHCVRGHLLSGDNLRLQAKGLRRICRACCQIRDGARSPRNWRKARKERGACVFHH